MVGSGIPILGLAQLLYDEITSAGTALALALAVNGYDIKTNWLRVLVSSLFIGTASAGFFFFPQTMRVIALGLLYFAFFLFYYKFTARKAILVLFTTHFLLLIGIILVSLIQVIGFNISMRDFLVRPLIHFLYPLPYTVPMAILACIAHKRNWHLFHDRLQFEIPSRLILPLFIQSLLTTIILCEVIVHYSLTTRIQNAIIASTLVVATILTYFFIWRILLAADREAVTAAHEQLAAEMNRQSDQIRAQRHDFVNHVQVISALLQMGQEKELASYVAAIQQSDGWLAQQHAECLQPPLDPAND